MTDLVRFEVDEHGVAAITLNRPERLNAINLEMRDQLWEYLLACRDMPGLRALVFRGEGPAFSAGADISEFGTAPSIIESRRGRRERDLWGLLLSLEVPTVARMHGFCYGAGLELPLCCDRRVAAEGTRLALPEVTLGYMPSAGGTQTLPRIAPPGVAAHLVLTGEPIEADAALRWGILDRVVPPTGLDAAVAEAVDEMSAAGRRAATIRRRRILEARAQPSLSPLA